MSAVSYVTLFALHGDLHIDSVIFERSFGYFYERLAELRYLTRKQLKFEDEKTMLQLKYYALAVYARKSKIVISEMFTTELKFTADSLFKWFNATFKSNNLELSNSAKRKYKIENSIDWLCDHCCICTLLLEFIATNLMRITKQCFMSILSFSRSIGF